MRQGCFRSAAWPRCVFAFAIFFLAQPAQAAPSNRWLLIVETSRAMQPRMEAVAQTAGNLILSGANGQMHPGDTLGVWTFNADLHAPEFPLQALSPRNANAIAERVAIFLATQTFEKRASFDQVLPAMVDVVTNSQFITVILITSGDARIRGTPFDTEINAFYKKWQSQQEKARMPFVTVLRAQSGRVTDFALNTPPMRLEMPTLPPELLVTNILVEKPAATPTPPSLVITQSPPVVPSLIVRGKKSEPEPEPVPPTMALATNQTIASEIKTSVPPVQPLLVNRPTATITNALVAPSITNQPTATVDGNSSSRKLLWYAGGGVVVVVGIGLAVVFQRRSRSGSHTSLITRSLDRDKKQ